ncbi:MAG: nuclear transport factor 2 family protein, partial [Pirellulaceae bacterium]
AIDRLDGGLMETLFHPDATDNHGMFKGRMADWMPWCLDIVGRMGLTQHVIGNVLIELHGDEARAESYYIVAQPQLPQEKGGVFVAASNAPTDQYLVAGGRYLDHLVRRDGAWKFQHRHVIYDWNLNPSPPDVWQKLRAAGWVFGTQGRDDASYSNFAGISSM